MKWTVEVQDSSAKIERSQEQILRDDYTNKVTYEEKSKDDDIKAWWNISCPKQLFFQGNGQKL